MLRFLKSLLILLVLTVVVKAQAPEGFAQYEIIEKLNPTCLAIDAKGTIFITEKHGKVLKVNESEGTFSTLINIEVDDYNDRGLLNILLDPEFEDNGFIYLYYTVKFQNHNRLSRFTFSENVILPNSEHVVMDFDPLGSSLHHGGAMGFGKDGKLYVCIGDGGNPSKVQNLDNLWGKVIRINTDGSIPDDNPYNSKTEGKNKAIYAIGIRNPYSMDIDHITGKIYINDVGNASFEEINEILPGKNYGWPDIEGHITYQKIPENYLNPIYAYPNLNEAGCSVLGAAFYRPANKNFPDEYTGKYFFGDYCGGYIKSLNPYNFEVTSFIEGANKMVAIQFNQEGHMYYLQRGAVDRTDEGNTFSEVGSLWKVVYTGFAKPNIAKHPSSVTISPEKEVRFYVIASGTANVKYQWQKNGIDIPNENAHELILKNVTLLDDGSVYQCKVFNDLGEDLSKEAVLRVKPNTNPQAFITSPSGGELFKAGETINFSGYGYDKEDGELPFSAHSWWIDLHHNDHTHPSLNPIKNVKAGSYRISQTDETEHNISYRIYLSVQDSEGAITTTYKEIFPQKVNVSLHSEVPGMEVILDGKYMKLPLNFTAVSGVIRTIESVPNIVKNENLYHPSNCWDDMEDPVLYFVTPDQDSVFNVNYQIFPHGEGNGLFGFYFSEKEASNAKYSLAKVDPLIDLEWPVDIPNSEIENEFSFIRWEGFLEPRFTELYKLSINTDGIVKLWLDDELIIDNLVFTGDDKNIFFGQKFLEANRKYRITLEYSKENLNGGIKLYWESRREIKEIIPASQLFLDHQNIPNKKTLNAEFSIYPVPVSDKLNFMFNSLSNNEATIQIYNSLGQSVFDSSFYLSPGLNFLNIDASSFKNGFYTFVFSNEEYRSKKSFIKE